MVAPRTSSSPAAARRVVLVTGFDAFGGDASNPSWLAAQQLQGETIAGHAVVAAQVPTQFAASLQRLNELLRTHNPALVLCLGLAANRNALSLERVAINVDDARIPDNAGAQPMDVPVVPGAPAAYFTRLPIKAMRAALRDAGMAAEVSQTAGTFVCNHVFYALMHALATRPELAGVRGGFMHVPPLADHAANGMPLTRMVDGLRIALRTAIDTVDDVAQSGGAIA